MRYRLIQSVVLLTLASLVFALSPEPAKATRNEDGVWSILHFGINGPSSRKHHTMVYDSVDDHRIILYGGETTVSGQKVVLNDLWELDLDTGAWTELSLSNGPTRGRHGHSAVYDAANDQMLILGGRSDFPEDPEAPSFPDEVWALSLGSGTPAWSLHSEFPPPTTKFWPCNGGANCGKPFSLRTHTAAAALSTGLHLMGGLADNTLAMHDTWRSDLLGTGGNDEWSHVYGSVIGIFDGNCEPESCVDFNTPDLRYWHTMIADGYGRLVVFGGFYPETPEDPISNVFVSSDGGNSWTFLGIAPATGGHNFSREFHSSVFDAVGNRMVVVGGYIRAFGQPLTITDRITSLPLPQSLPQFDEEPTPEVNDNWVLHEASGCGPGEIAEHDAVYDSQNDRVIVFGGVNGSGAFIPNHTYALSFAESDLDQTPPAAVTLTTGQIGRTSSTIKWNAPGDDGVCGTAFTYDLRRSTSTITESNFCSATPVATDPPDVGGTIQCATAGLLSECETYYYALRTIDDAGNVSALSNVLSITQNCSGLSYVCDEQDVTPPSAVTLSAGQIGRYGSTVTWTAPGDDGNTGTAASYDLRRSTSVITCSNFSSATQVATDAPSGAGSGECATSYGLSQCQTYYYALRTTDDAGNISPLSNVLSIKQKCSGASYICDGGGLGPVSAPAMPQMVEYAIRGANPASGVTTLFVGIPTDRQGEAMEISIFDVTGARIRTLTQGAAAAGEREFTWDHRANNGAAVAGGVYFARLQLGNETRTHKIVVSTGR